MNPVVHFELPATDLARSKKFYETAFGWKLDQLGAEMNNYVVAHTAETGADRMIKKPGMINGGIFERTEGQGTQHPSVVIAVDDIHEHVKIIVAAGGKVLNEPMEIPGIGMFATFEDTEGNRLSVLQPLMAQA
jgi:predicted enzyme related to lactoylglutathione lyase